MNWLWYMLAGALGGVLAGMGMGGGTLTIPLLVLGLGVGQLTAQFVNLIAFLPSGGVALALHVKGGLVDAKGLAPLFASSIAASAVCSAFAAAVGDGVLRILFGVFLIAVALVSMGAKIFKKS